MTFVFAIEDYQRDDTYERLLKWAGLKPEEFLLTTDKENFLTLAKSYPRPNAILMNLGFNPERGYALFRTIKADEWFKDTWIIAITGYAGSDTMREAQRAGFDGFIGKPLDIEKFPKQMRQILRREPVWDPQF